VIYDPNAEQIVSAETHHMNVDYSAYEGLRVRGKAATVLSRDWWIVDGDTYLGAIDLRHYLNAFLLEGGGHIGYSVRPSARRRGLATWALGTVLLKAPALGLDRVLLTCDDGNIGSARTIESNGGVLEDVRSTEAGLKRRYWITLGSR